MENVSEELVGGEHVCLVVMRIRSHRLAEKNGEYTNLTCGSWHKTFKTLPSDHSSQVAIISILSAIMLQIIQNQHFTKVNIFPVVFNQIGPSVYQWISFCYVASTRYSLPTHSDKNWAEFYQPFLVSFIREKLWP